MATAQDRPINESCLALAEQGSCDFYTCFESRLPCGREGYMLRNGQYYCNKLNRNKSRFSPEGQQFLDDAQRCLTRSLKDMYERDFVDCHDLEHYAVQAIAPCFVDNGFCDIVEKDIEHFFDVYEFRDLFTRGAGKIWKTILNLGTRCGSEALTDLTSETGDFIDSLFDRFGK